MGAGQSIFYPDNPKRRKRAEELGNDCKYAQEQYDTSKANIERELGPYKEKMNRLLQAFNCRNIDDFDRLIQQTATGAALEHWNKVRENYDKSQEIDQIIMAAEGVVTIVGFTVSVIGALTGAFGFFVGLGVTADILLVLGLLGAIFDLIDGAIQRSKLRDAINELVPTRIKARYAATQMQNLEKCIPSIKLVYATFEKAGYDKDKIAQLMKEGDILDSLQKGQTNITYRSIGQELANQDSGRGSWTNEDPSWQVIAAALDAQAGIAGGGAKAVALRMATSEKETAGPTLEHGDGYIVLKLTKSEAAPVISGQLHVKLDGFEGDDAARALIHVNDDKEALDADTGLGMVQTKPVSATEDTKWLLSFVNPGDAEKFSTAGKTFDASRIPQVAEIFIQADSMYLTRDGGLSPAATPLMVSYA
ncbi:hypothetical protein V5O48_011889 [Marasmius crinis-equi]|uniref:Uncharacterized protein n=1 Tax=Marasmius crinis-equi TaxID=585013 RepID=A0ABR3F4D6_9AGAR